MAAITITLDDRDSLVVRRCIDLALRVARSEFERTDVAAALRVQESLLVAETAAEE